MKGNASNTPNENDLDNASTFLGLKGILRFDNLPDPAGRDPFREQCDRDWKDCVRKKLREQGITLRGRLVSLVDTLARVKNALPRVMAREGILKVQHQLHDTKAHLLTVTGAEEADPKFIQRLCDEVFPDGVQAVMNTGEIFETF
jgi:hypothetical protein